MKRIGECKACGQCCAYVGFRVPNTVGFDEWAVARGILHGYEDNCETAVVLLRSVCPHLVVIDGQGRCDLHGTRDKPDVCVESPYRPEDVIIPGCGYSFVEEEADNA